ncbi:MAG: sugar ABC transporter ATP-binding protein, partial [Nocardioidaceae bacterium]
NSGAGVDVCDGVGWKKTTVSFLALPGETGAGKSTLVKILVGDYSPDAGQIWCDQQDITGVDPAQARHLGIRMIFQELSDAPPLTVAENICLGQLPTRRGRVDWQAARRLAVDALASLGSDIDPDRIASSLRVGERQLVEVARALLGSTRCLILDEPTATLSADETERLFRSIRALRANGVAIIYITHRLDEVRDIADRVQVLRDGSTVLEGDVADHSRHGLVEAMVGRSLDPTRRPEASLQAMDAGPVVRLVGLSADRAFADVDLELRAGEIVALYGKVGAGTGEVAEAIYGVRPISSGSMEIGGRVTTVSGPPSAIDQGVGMVPGDRQRDGAFMNRSVAENLSIATWRSLSWHGVITRAKESAAYLRWHDRLTIRSRNEPRQPMVTLSGGNQQKVLLGRWLERDVRVLLLVEPTRGVDVGAREEIYRTIRALTGEGLAVLVTTSDHEEVVQLADRALVMVRGRVVRELRDAEMTAADVVSAAAG